MHHRHEIRVTGFSDRIEHGEIDRIAEAETPAYLPLVARPKMIEGRTLPVRRRLPRDCRTIFEFGLDFLDAVPAEGAALMHRMQRIHQRQTAVER